MRCRIVIQEGVAKVRKPFKFINAIAEFPEFLPLVKDFWATTDPLSNSTSALHRLSKKLKLMKPLLRQQSSYWGNREENKGGLGYPL